MTMRCSLVSNWEHRWKGQPVVITACGPSLIQHDLRQIPHKIIGINYSFRAVWPNVLCATDQVLYRGAPGVCEVFERWGALFTPAKAKFGIGHAVPNSQEFSTSFRKGIQGGGSTTYFAVQVALCMGVSEIFILGLDGGPVEGQCHFYPGSVTEPPPDRLLKDMHIELSFYAPDVPVWLVGSPQSRCEGIPHKEWPWGGEPLKKRLYQGRGPEEWRDL